MQRFFEPQNAEISTERRFSNWTRIHSGGKSTSPGSDKQRDSAGELADQAAMMEHQPTKIKGKIWTKSVQQHLSTIINWLVFVTVTRCLLRGADWIFSLIGVFLVFKDLI